MGVELADQRERNRLKQVKLRQNPGPARAQTQKRQDVVCACISEGMTIADACAEAGIQPNTETMWRKRYPPYRQRIKRIMANRRSGVMEQRPFDAEFRERYFSADYEAPITPPHLQKLMDVLNEQQQLAEDSKSRKHRVLVLMPPEHAKTSLLMDYVTYRISQDPTFRCVLISSTLGQARKRVGVIQRRLTERKDYEDFIDTYGPFKSELRIEQKPWTKDHFTILKAPAGQVDYTLEALGIGGSIYGNRADLILFDDIATQKNQTPAEVDKQWNWIWGEVRSRIRKGGLFVVIGTRMTEQDIYQVMEEKGFFTDKVIFPAVVREPGTDGDDDPGEALWPEQNPLEELIEIRSVDQRLFELQYQQNPLPSVGTVFPIQAIESCYDPSRMIGDIPRGCRVVAGIDPSVRNYTSAVALAIAPSGMRYLVDVWNEKGLTGEGGDIALGLTEFITEFCARYGVRTLALESNSTFALLSANLNLRMQLNELGVYVMTPAIGPASGEKEELALAQLSGLFTKQLISIPAQASATAHFREFVNQLATWHPKQGQRQPQDMVKALRMAEMAARREKERYLASSENNHDPSMPSRWKGKQLVYG